MKALHDVTVRVNSGTAWEMKKGQRARITFQSIVDFVVFNRDSLQERTSAVRKPVSAFAQEPTSKLQFGLLPASAVESVQQSECTICEKRRVPSACRPVWLPHEAADTSPAAL
jgi:hypothetical protein